MASITVSGSLEEPRHVALLKMILRRSVAQDTRSIALTRKEVCRVVECEGDPPDDTSAIDALESIAGLTAYAELEAGTDKRPELSGFALFPLVQSIISDSRPDLSDLFSITITKPAAALTRMHDVAWLDWPQPIDFRTEAFERD